MDRMIAGMLVMSQQNASLLIVLQDNTNVTMVIVHFRCIFVIAMMIVEMALTKGIAKISNVMVLIYLVGLIIFVNSRKKLVKLTFDFFFFKFQVNNSNVQAIMKLQDFVFQLNVNVIGKS